MGLETEYVVLYRSPAGSNSAVGKPGEDPTPSTLSDVKFDFEKFAKCLLQELPLAKSFRTPYRVFLANGGCVSLEHGLSLNLRDVLVESATPECKSPKELLTYQLALERILSRSIHKTFGQYDAQLLKGSADSNGNTYGQHESYELRIASNGWLLGWRLGLVCMLPLIVSYRLLAGIWFIMIWLMSQMTDPWIAMKRSLFRDPEHFSASPSRAPSFWGVHPRWLGTCACGLRVLHLPLAASLWLNIRCFALIPHRRHLTAFFASRSIVDGAGYLDKRNRFWVSVRSALVNSVIGFGSYRNERPIFRCDGLLRGLCTGPVWTLGNYAQLFRRRQRIEIAIGDSGLCEQSQYVRLGATALVLDLVERSNPNVPRLRNVVEATTRFAKDWMLLTSVPDRKQMQWTALDIQHAYASEVRNFLQKHPNVPIEAWRILDQWQTTLNQLRPTDDESNLPRTMLGRIDWLSKLWILHQMKSETSWQARKKVDLRYHEISNEGYHYRLHRMLELAPLLDERELLRAARIPPADTPATHRGYIVREFSDDECDLRVDWTRAEFLIEGQRNRVFF